MNIVSFPLPFQIWGKIMIQCVVPCTVHEIATCHFQCTLITAAAWAMDGEWLFVFKSHSVDVALLRGACHCFRVNYRWAVIAARCSVSHEPETQRHTPHAFVVGGLHFATLGHLQRRKCQTFAVSLDLMKRTSLEKHSDPIFCVSVLQILRSTTGRRQWFLISLSRPACRAWWTLELQIIHLTKVRSPNI